MQAHLIDEILEAVWIADEDGDMHISKLDVDCPHDVVDIDIPECIAQLADDGLLAFSGDEVAFTPSGRKKAQNVIRRHRLAQRLLMDVLDVSEKESEAMACKFEHILSEEVTDKVSAFLGHPTFDPNGRPIPAGDNTSETAELIAPLVSRLNGMKVGSQARIAFLTPSFHKRFDRLAAFGINPGSEITLHQTRPAFVVRIGETELALDKDIAREIFVRPLTD
ncbi:metal-dependent transcriptional regulator [Candidatus Neomarinimicrobiota bacterium]